MAAVIVLALIEIPEDAAADGACAVAAGRVPYKHRVRAMTQRVLQGRPGAAQVRWAVLARQDAADVARRRAGEGGETSRTR